MREIIRTQGKVRPPFIPPAAGEHPTGVADITDVLPGLKGTYQGLTATVLKQGSNQAIRFYVMTVLRNWYKGVCQPAVTHS